MVSKTFPWGMLMLQINCGTNTAFTIGYRTLSSGGITSFGAFRCSW